MALFIDIGDLSERQTDVALNLIYKAIHDHGDDESIWDEHPSPFVRRLIELFTARGLTRIDGVHNELKRWFKGEMHQPGAAVPARPEGLMYRWTDAEFQLARLYLQSLPPDSWTLEDNMMLVDYLVQRYLPASEIITEAEWLATRAVLMGRVQANMQKMSFKQADKALAALPSTVRQSSEMFHMTPAQESVLRYGAARAAENVVRLSDTARYRMRNLIMTQVADQMVQGKGETLKMTPSLETMLSDEFATLNRDWRRIAVTEASELQNQGYIASLRPGTKVKRVEQYDGACAFCRKIDGVIMEVVAADDPNKDGEKHIWPGKTNIGRAAAPRKRVGNMLIEREPHERWWIAAGTMHPHCRGRWIPVTQDEPGDDPDFAAWLRETLEKR